MENNTYRWSYNYSLFKNRDWIKIICIMVALTVFFICFALFLAAPHDFWGTLTENFWLIWMIVAIYGLSVLISLIWYRKGYVYQYVLERGWIKVNRNYVPMSHEMIVDERIGSHIDLKTVSYIRLDKDTDSISMRGFLLLTTIYADKNEIDHVYQLIKQECVNLKGEK
ncbi:MAG: hypothetical protein MSA26_01530 [Lachnospiraceae bacterium]|nr:hypothetical protein [Lachnospiraceae bacterium]